MKQFLCSILFSLMLSISAFSQDNLLKGQWKLAKVEVTDLAQKNLSNEEAFFAFYLDESKLLNIDNNFFPIVVGGDEIPYTYKIDGKHLVLIYTNTIIIKEGNSKPKEKTSIGETSFNFHLEENILTLTRRNETFKEFYQFQKITN